MSKEIKRNWCIYKNVLGQVQGFGKIEEEDKTSIRIRYSEGQMYKPQLWDSNFVKKFSTLEKAVRYYIKNQPAMDSRDRGMTPEETREYAKHCFPSYFKKKK